MANQIVLMTRVTLPLVIVLLLAGCDSATTEEPDSLNISPAVNADAGSSYSNSMPDIWIPYWDIPFGGDNGDLRDAVAYLDADGDGDTDIFLATGQYLLQGEVNSLLAINDGSESFTIDNGAFSNGPPPATHARKSLVADFDGNGLDDIMILDHGYDSNPYPGSQPKLVLQTSIGQFSWSRVDFQTGFHHGGAAGDVDNDGDIDVFVGGFEPFFLLNDGTGNFEYTRERFTGNIQKIFAAELIDVDDDGYLDLLVGAHERDGDRTAIYWGGSTGYYTDAARTSIPSVSNFGAVLDFDLIDVNGDGENDIVVNRTRDGDDGPNRGFYQGQFTQLLTGSASRSFDDQSGQLIDNAGGDDDSWFPWVRVHDINDDGVMDFGSDDASHGYMYLGNGDGTFTRSDVTSG